MLHRQESLLHRIGKAFRAHTDDVTQEPVPTRWADLIRYLDDQERRHAEQQAKTEQRDQRRN